MFHGVTIYSIVVVNSSGKTAVLQDDPLLSDLLPDKFANKFSASTSNPRRLIDELVTVHNGYIADTR